mgnify:CR=1 FL=1
MTRRVARSSLGCVRLSRFIATAAALGLAGAAVADAPRRVVSMNLCTDQLAMLIAAPGQLVSVSYVAKDPYSSALAEQAKAYPQNRGGAEEIFRMQPDLVLADVWSDSLATGMLSDLGVEIVRFEGVSSLEAIPVQLRRMGEVLGQGARAEALATEVETRLASLPLPPPIADQPEAAFFFAGGYSLGEGTLSDDILSHAGFRNLANRVDRTDGGYIPVEVLLMNRPDLLITAPAYDGASQAEALMAHPALAEIPRVESGADWGCGLPFVLDAVEALIAVRQTLGN